MNGGEEGSRAMEYFELLSPSSQYILEFSPFFINHVSVSLMTDLIENRRKSALYICVGRPHIFIQKMLHNRGVSTKSVHFMDMVLYVCRDSNKRCQQRVFYHSDGDPVELPTIFKLFKVDQEVDSLSLENVDIIVLDNLSELRTYNNDDQLRRFIEILHEVSCITDKGLLMFHLNNRPDDGIDRICGELGVEKVELPNDAFSN